MHSSILNLSPWTLIFGIIIILMSVVEAFLTGKTGKEQLRSRSDKQHSRRQRFFKAFTALLAIALLFIQAASNKRSDATAQAALRNALDNQKTEITSYLADASLGSSLCPQLVADHISSDRPYGLSVFNFDKTANIYDLVVYVQEGEHAGADGRGFRTLQQKTLRFPTVPAGAGTPSQPFEFLSQRNTSFLQYSLSTRRKICSGQIVLHGDGNGNWRPESYAVHEGPLDAHNTEVPQGDQP
jgi:hypothetical protein